LEGLRKTKTPQPGCAHPRPQILIPQNPENKVDVLTVSPRCSVVILTQLLQQGCTNLGRKLKWRQKFVRWGLSIEPVSCDPSGAWNFQVSPVVPVNLCTTVLQLQ